MREAVSPPADWTNHRKCSLSHVLKVSVADCSGWNHDSIYIVAILYLPSCPAFSATTHRRSPFLPDIQPEEPSLPRMSLDPAELHHRKVRARVTCVPSSRRRSSRQLAPPA